MFIKSILPSLSDPSSAYNNQHMFVLNSLADVKSIVLLTDIPSSESLIVDLFSSFFDILAGSSKASTGEQLGKNVAFNMTAILGIMVDESQNLPSEAIDIIVAQFLRTDPRAITSNTSKSKKNGVTPALDDKQSVFVLNEYPPAYNTAMTICNSYPEKMARYVGQYFNDVIMEASKPAASNGVRKDRSHRKSSRDSEDVEDDYPGGPTEEDLKELSKAHQLLRELWRASPTVLQNVIPQLEAELAAENVQLRLLATQTLGDIVSGIGAAGPPPPPAMDPARYPPIGLSGSAETKTSQNLLFIPSSPQPFPQVHPQAYTAFLGRKLDKSVLIRSAWTTGVGRILTTSAGGVGLVQNDEHRLVNDLARMLGDPDEKVRITAVKAVASFGLRDVVVKLGSSGSVEESGSVLGTLAERTRDRKHPVRVEAMKVLARIWGVALGEIANGDEQVLSTIGAAPSKILNTYYTNDLEINLLLDQVMFELLLPLSYPPIKAKAAKMVNGSSQSIKDSQGNGAAEADSFDPDKIRAERILSLVKSLDEKAKKVFFTLQTRQVMMAKLMSAFLQACEDYNVSIGLASPGTFIDNRQGGVMDTNESLIKERLTRLINEFAKQYPDASKVSADIWKFAKLHDRRSYQLIRFCIAPESDYRTVYKAIKEFTKRIDASTSTISDTLVLLLYRCSTLVYNKSHVPAVMEYSKTDDNSLASTAHEVLKDISARNPDALKAQVQELCRILQDEAPTAKQPNDIGAVNRFKACAAFAHKFSKEIPQDRKFTQAMISFAMHGSPPETSKYAVSIVMATSEKKEMFAKDLVQKCVKGITYDCHGFLSRLATLSQLMLLAPNEVDEEFDKVIDVAVNQILQKVRAPSTEPTDSYKWSTDTDTECASKSWALKILVNRIIAHPNPSSLSEVCEPVYTLLLKLITQEGELFRAKNTPSSHKPRLRLCAARLFLKLCTSKSHDALLTPAMFNDLALVALDPIYQVRTFFLQRLQKYLVQGKLSPRFYTIPFLLAFEPDEGLKSEMTTWIRSRALYLSSLKSPLSDSTSASAQPASKASIILETVFARLISLLAHHPDYGSSAEDIVEFARYIHFYLSTVANEENLSLIYHVAQSIKGCRDAISLQALSNSSPPQSKSRSRTSASRSSVTPSEVEAETSLFDDNLYHLSDLAQLTIRKFEEQHGWMIQALPSQIKTALPRSLYVQIRDHEVALSIAEKNFLDEDVEEGVSSLLRKGGRKEKAGSKGKKRKSSDEADEGGRKKPRKGMSGMKTLRKDKDKVKLKKGKKEWEDEADDNDDDDNEETRKPSAAGERRRSERASLAGAKSYAERDDDEDDKEMLDDNTVDEAEVMDDPEDEPEDHNQAEPQPTHTILPPSDPPSTTSPPPPHDDDNVNDNAEPLSDPPSSPAPTPSPSHSPPPPQPKPSAKPPKAPKPKPNPKPKQQANGANTQPSRTTRAGAKRGTAADVHLEGS